MTASGLHSRAPLREEAMPGGPGLGESEADGVGIKGNRGSKRWRCRYRKGAPEELVQTTLGALVPDTVK